MSYKIHIALASDDNYFEGLLTTAWSIARNCSRADQLVFHILDGGITDEHWLILSQKISPFDSQLDRIVIDQTQRIGSFRAYHGTGRMTYARLLLPDLLPNVSHIVYSDVDVLWLTDIADLWDSLVPENVLYARRPDRPTTNRIDPAELAWFDQEGFDTRQVRRFCAGILTFNLEKFRNEGLHLKMLALLDKHRGHVPHVDETVLNAYMIGRDDVGDLERRWHMTSGGLSGTPDARGIVLHYAVDTPWKPLVVHHMVTDSILLWHHCHSHLNGTTTWRSLRACNSPFSLILGRILYLLTSRSSLMLKLLDIAMILSGRRAGIPCVHDFTHKTELTALLQRVR